MVRYDLWPTTRRQRPPNGVQSPRNAPDACPWAQAATGCRGNTMVRERARMRSYPNPKPQVRQKVTWTQVNQATNPDPTKPRVNDLPGANERACFT